ncbi:competence/damage-inducible protein A [Alphaproteobacteria bacterium]|nr:competence/damage-inducible protein A [Alphaproteobacteria bacterium]
MSKFTAGIIVIGDEILSGRTQDINSNFIAKHLVKAGIKLEEIRIIQDDREAIIQNIIHFHKTYTYVFTTGGIGPTHDDITSESVSLAFNEKYCFHPKAFKILEEYYSKGEFNEGRQKMAKMPENAQLILNPLSVAPGFIIRNVYVLPGIPEIMQKMFVNVLQHIKKGPPKTTITINTNLYESNMAIGLAAIQNKNLNFSIGSYPYYNYIDKIGGVNIVISSWDSNNLGSIVVEIKKMILLLGGKSTIV